MGALRIVVSSKSTQRPTGCTKIREIATKQHIKNGDRNMISDSVKEHARSAASELGIYGFVKVER
jgi:hypothetical protein